MLRKHIPSAIKKLVFKNYCTRKLFCAFSDKPFYTVENGNKIMAKICLQGHETIVSSSPHNCISCCSSLRMATLLLITPKYGYRNYYNIILEFYIFIFIVPIHNVDVFSRLHSFNRARIYFGGRNWI